MSGKTLTLRERVDALEWARSVSTRGMANPYLNQQIRDLRRQLSAATSRPAPAPQTKHKPQTIAELRSIFGDERKDKCLFDTFPEPMQRSWLEARQRAGERLTLVERRSVGQPRPIERVQFAESSLRVTKGNRG